MPGIQAAIAELQANDGNYAEAEESYRKELALTPGNARVNYRYGIILQQIGRDGDSIPYLRKAVAGDPSIVDAYAQLGKALLAGGDIEGSEKVLLHVLTMAAAPETLRATHYQLGQLYRKQGNAAAAAKHLKAFNQLRAAEKEAN
jgi:tetratricopeptide (TPR) repeat protein